MNPNLEIQFEEAFKKVSETEKVLAPDVLLRLYAYYKQATKGDNFSMNQDDSGIRNAFKFNAWVQLKGMSELEAMEEYIKLTNQVLG